MNMILVIDDEPDFRAEIAEELSNSGYRVLEVENGQIGLSRILEARPDLVICDINMPVLSGYDVLDRLRRCHPECSDTPVIFLSALADRASIIDGKRRGADDYLTKPVDFDDLLATVAARLRQVSRMRQTRHVESAALSSHAPHAPNDEFASATASLRAVLDRLSFAVFLLDAGSRVLYENRLAVDFAKRREFVFRANGRLVTARSDEAKALAGIVASAAESRDDAELAVRLSSNEDGRPAIAIAAPLRIGGAAADAGQPLQCILCVIDTQSRNLPSAGPLASAYGLTPAEQRVLQCLIDGHRISEVVEELGTSRNTVATHLKSIFRKTGTTRQSEIMALTLMSAGWH